MSFLQSNIDHIQLCPPSVWGSDLWVECKKTEISKVKLQIYD